jgi:hypothetical protein
MAEEQNIRTYDSYIKEFMGACSEKNVIRFINALYGESLPLDSVVKRLETETDVQGEVRRSDFMIMVNERIFHIEVESKDKDDNEMVFRMFEYGVRGAYMHSKTITDNRMTIRLPNPIVIYLRSSPKTPTEFIVDYVLPNNEIFSQVIPVKRLSDYTPETLLEGKLYPLSLFYPMVYESLLHKKHTGEDETRFTKEIELILEMLETDKDKGEINKTEFGFIVDGIEKIAEKVISKAQILNREEVGGLMERIQRKYASDYLNAIDEAEQKNKRETARRMKQDNLPLDTIKKYTDLPAETIQAL